MNSVIARYWGMGFSGLLLASSAFGIVVGTTGNSTLIPRPADARTGVLASATQAYVWNEAQGFLLTGPLAVDADHSGTFKLNDLSTSFIPTGTRVNSHSFSFETPGGADGSAQGSVTFDHRIIGVVARNNPDTHLDDSNFLGQGTLFTTSQLFSGLDGDEPISISPDMLTFTYDIIVTSPGDRFRIITEVPEPGGAASLLVAGLTIGGSRKRSRRGDSK